MILSDNHWRIENFTQRVTRKEWKQILLEHGDRIIYKGQSRQLQAKHIGVGVYEISKKPRKEAP